MRVDRIHLPGGEVDQLCFTPSGDQRHPGTVLAIRVGSAGKGLLAVDEHLHDAFIHEHTEFEVLVLRKKDVCRFRYTGNDIR